MTPSYYNKWAVPSRFATDVNLLCNFPMAQFEQTEHCKKLNKKTREPFLLQWSLNVDLGVSSKTLTISELANVVDRK